MIIGGVIKAKDPLEAILNVGLGVAGAVGIAIVATVIISPTLVPSSVPSTTGGDSSHGAEYTNVQTYEEYVASDAGGLWDVAKTFNNSNCGSGGGEDPDPGKTTIFIIYFFLFNILKSFYKYFYKGFYWYFCINFIYT
jgi:hypothetical protein